MAYSGHKGADATTQSGDKTNSKSRGRLVADTYMGGKADYPRGGKKRADYRADKQTDRVRCNNDKQAKPKKPRAAPYTFVNATAGTGKELASTAGTSADLYDPTGVRLQKVLAGSGVGSRRAAEKLIAAGRVSVNGVVITEQGMRVNPCQVIVRVDGIRLLIDEYMNYLVLNKPLGYHSTMVDDYGRPCVGDLVAEVVSSGQRIFHVGRLDADTEGLLLMTNDGELAHRLMHPSFKVPKTYLATVRGVVPRGLSRKVRNGIDLYDGPVSVDEFVPIQVWEGTSLVRITLHEGRNRIVRRLLYTLGFPVVRLVRTEVGPLSLGDQHPGSIRLLRRDEIGALYQAVGL